MNLESGFQLLIQQLKALVRKNLLVSWRNKASSFMQIFASFFFLLLIFGLRKADEARLSSSTAYEQVSDPRPLVSPPVPLCEDKLFVKKPCFDFAWSGNGSSRIQTIVNSIMANNPGRQISSSKVKSFRTKAEVDKWLNENPRHCSGALHFAVINDSVISYGIQVASDSQAKRGRFEDSVFEFQIPLQIAAEREIARSLIGDKNFSWIVSLAEFAHPAMRIVSPMEFRLPPAFLATSMFSFVIQMSSLIAEKELKLRQAMTLMGLYDSAYWLSWLVWEGFLTFVSSLFIVLFGFMFRFDVFLRNSFSILFLVFFLFQLNMLGLAFMFSSIMSSSSSSTVVGYSVFIVGLMTQLVTAFGFPYSHNIPKMYQIIWSFFPPNLLAEALSLLVTKSTTSDDDALLYKRADTCKANEKSCEIMTISEINMWLVFTFLLWFSLAIYFDNVIPDSFGVRKSIFYFLKPGYWTTKSGNKMEETESCRCMSSSLFHENTPSEDEDVFEEENLVKQQASEGVDDPKISVQIRGLQKTYQTGSNINCFRCKKSSPYQALKGLWMNLAKDQLFCLLGHNGAGKTTAMNCLIGITPITGGDALIYGNSIRTLVGMSNIRKLLGVCPQFDVLWDSLSGQEHLQLFASIKGLKQASIQSVSKRLLEKMRLTEAARVRTGSYSGGMKRRLSVAIALIGDPKLVVLDEPTTGMDPITRRHVWDVIEESKKGRAIFLTTHSMEEADVLSDRIGIMAKGKLRCIGTSIRLKSRFGTGFVANVRFNSSAKGKTPTDWDIGDEYHYQEDVKEFFKYRLDVVPKEENKAFMTFVIPLYREMIMPEFFEDLEERKSDFGIKDIQLGLTTLEEVFLNISRQAELETATAEGRLVKFTLTTGLTIEIPIGAQIVGIPGTESEENPRGIMIEVYWSQDDSGALCISSHSNEISIPPSIEPFLPTLNANFTNREGLVRGFVIDPNHITDDSKI